MTTTTEVSTDLIAAIDLGSNSFHMILAREDNGRFQILEKRGSKVQLAAGLDNSGLLSHEAQQRGLNCLREFAQYLQGMDASRVSILATNALRQARNRQQFIDQAEAILGYPIEIIAGREEARLIYLGVAHTLNEDIGQRLVVDIGGGSTEFIIGQGFEPLQLESLQMGCVAYTQRFFPDGLISEQRFDAAVAAAGRELQSIQANYQRLGWDIAIGSSGTIRAAVQSVHDYGWESEGISSASMRKLRAHLLALRCTDDIDLPGVKYERRQVFIGGLAILQAVFDTLQLEHMLYSDGALREGTLWNMVGRADSEHVRLRTVQDLAQRYQVDGAQAQRVQQTALHLFEQVRAVWQFDNSHKQMLSVAAELHEMGLSIAHTGYHKHGAYILENSDLLGFTRQSQAKVAVLVRTHRRAIESDTFASIVPAAQPVMMRLARILRIAATLHRARGAIEIPPPQIHVVDEQVHVQLPAQWLQQHPFIAQDLADEIGYQQQMGWQLSVA